MANRSNIMGLHGLKNKTSRNSFDLSHRNLFTAKVGELLPCFVQEVNPGDSIKLDSSYFTRTAPLQTAAFTRLRENVQYFFVPYQCLWKYFEGQVKNMTKNANGGDVSQIAKSPFANAKVSTEMPYISYSALHSYVNRLVNGNYPVSPTPHDELANYHYINGCYRHAETAKLLQMLGYGNFNQQFEKPHDTNSLILENVKNAPALSVFRLLAYQKICNDFYIYRQWQPYNASLCNIDYITPDSANMDLSPLFTSQLVPGRDLDHLNILDMRFSNLPLDYFNGVLPTPQYGDDSIVNLTLGTATGSATISGVSGGPLYNVPQGSQFRDGINNSVLKNLSDVSLSSDINGDLLNPINKSHVGYINTPHTHSLSGSATINTALSGSLSVLALRQATALQKYKEIQLANDPDFESQVEAHFGIKPKHDLHKSRFIGGASSMIDINPVVNQNLGSGPSMNNDAVTKAAPTGQGGANFKFTADTYGVVIGIYRCTPVLDYEHVGIDRTLLKTDAVDFVIPELDSIGMQQTFNCELYAPSSVVQGSNPPEYDMSSTYGYAPRYAEYKTSFDRFNGAFGASLKSWVTGLNSITLKLDRYWSDDKFFINTPQLFVCRPDIVKNIFLIQQYLNSNDDNLYVGMVNMCYATRNLSRYGLPYSN